MEHTVTVNNTTTRYIIEHHGYHLAGFYEGEDETAAKVTTVIKSGSTGLRNLIPLWQIKNYTVTYDVGVGGENSSENPLIYNVESDAITLKEPVRTGYTFVCWEDDDGNTVTAIPKGSFGDICLTAKWTVIEYTITFELDGGEWGEEEYPTVYTIESETIVLSVPIKDGYDFVCWEDNEGNVVIEIPQGSTGNVTLKAVWLLTVTGGDNIEAEHGE